MSHHFDTKLAKEDPSLNVCDLYLFQGAPDTTVMAMTVNPDAVLSALDTLHIEGLYAFRLDLTGDAREDVVFKFRFNEPRHVNADEHVHVQKFQVRRATGDAIGGDKGELLIEGDTGKVHSKSGIRAFVGIAPDLFAADAVAMQNLQKAFYNEHRYDSDAFQRHRQNFFNNRNITAIVLEVPNHLIGKGTVHAWATVSLYGHAPEMQVSRWGLPMITHLFLNDPGNQEVKETFNKSVPSDDIALFSFPPRGFHGPEPVASWPLLSTLLGVQLGFKTHMCSSLRRAICCPNDTHIALFATRSQSCAARDLAIYALLDPSFSLLRFRGFHSPSNRLEQTVDSGQ